MISVSPVQSSLVFGAVRRASPLLSYPTLFHRSPNCRYEKEVSLFPQPRQSNLPAPTSPKLPSVSACLCLSLLFPPLGTPVCPRQSSPPASMSHFFCLTTKGSPACQPVGFHGPTSLPVNQAPSAGGTPPALPCRACVRPHACRSTAPSQGPLQDPPGPSTMAQQ